MSWFPQNGLTSVNWFAEGDSITFGLGGQPAYPNAALSLMSGVASTPNSNTPIDVFVPGVGPVHLLNFGSSGISSLTIDTNYTTRGGLFYKPGAHLNLFSLMAGTNTSGGTDSSALQKYIIDRRILRKAKATGYQRRIICDMVARADDGSPYPYWTNILSQMNSYFASYYNVQGELDCDGYVNFASDTRFNTPSNISTSTWYNPATDLVHPSILGEGPTGMGGIASPIVLAVLKAPGVRIQAPMTWSIFDASNSAALSNSNRTYTNATLIFGFPIILGKRYWEVVPGVSSTNTYVGVSNDNNQPNLGGFFLYNNVNSLAYIYDGRIMINNVVIVTAATFAAGDVIQFAMDQPNQLIWMRRVRSGTPQSWNGNGSADPATGVGGISTASLGDGISVYIRPAGELALGTSNITSNFATNQLTGSIPTGFLALDG